MPVFEHSAEVPASENSAEHQAFEYGAEIPTSEQSTELPATKNKPGGAEWREKEMASEDFRSMVYLSLPKNEISFRSDFARNFASRNKDARQDLHDVEPAGPTDARPVA